MTMSDTSVLDDPVGTSLTGTHAHLARRVGRAVTFEADVATFSSVGTDPDLQSWADLARLLGPGGAADLFDCPAPPPAEWEQVFSLDGVQLVATTSTNDDAETDGSGYSALVELGADDVPAMLDLVRRTAPGPFRPRTHELGTYLGVVEGGTLVAMAGERLRPPGWTEISAVCSAPEARGRGYATRLVTALAARIAARGERPFLHAAASNTGAIALYERLGFAVRKPVTFRGFRVPDSVR
ncbi:GNAT family N-acetyltransferase [Saccharomonospora sp. CUA-673]|uniref:GNAT family N-acetyltransferase n=1 Tax=Saccharomonospora sp. CUA-673 TaxID=1904969 RepID=UPI0009684C66|nr:GNAT family N-acetyltransferase [Saccharomonospora sp. CUA-673]OLT46998.1 GNAT family N-acetyltransferase [Saccharomonospora sp. CUA-673]